MAGVVRQEGAEDRLRGAPPRSPPGDGMPLPERALSRWRTSAASLPQVEGPARVVNHGVTLREHVRTEDAVEEVLTRGLERFIQLADVVTVYGMMSKDCPAYRKPRCMALILMRPLTCRWPWMGYFPVELEVLGSLPVQVSC